MDNEGGGTEFRAGHVALMGKPNVGKSTLLNHVVGQKVSIVSNKPQTTRRRVLGIANGPNYQIAFMDTPGVHEAHTQLGKEMVHQARAVLGDADVIVYVADAPHHPGDLDKQIAKMLEGVSAPRVLCLNKMDQLKAEDVQRNVDAYTSLFKTEAYMMTTATTGVNVDKLLEIIVSKLPVGAPMYPLDELTDQSSRFMAGEFVREKILQATKQEVPYATAVMVDSWEEDHAMISIDATILVEKASQRGILIGKQGQFIKKIGTSARADLEELFAKHVHLELHVKVSEGWRMNPRVLRELEYMD